MRRREFMAGLAGAAFSAPRPAQAQSRQRVRLIGCLSILAEDDPESLLRIDAFKKGLQRLGWKSGANVRFEERWAAGDENSVRRFAHELAALAPDVILTSGSVTVRPLQQVTTTVPIVFVQVVDPVGSGYVEAMARPGGNTTGFTQFEYSLSGKWVELLKEITPGLKRAAVIRDPTRGPGVAQFAAIQTVAQLVAVELRPVNALDVGEIERGLTSFARSPDGGIIVTSGGTGFHRDLIVGLSNRLRLPAVYPYRYFAAAGGLLSYGPETIDQFARAAAYVDRILKGEKPGEMPVQSPTKYELVLNLSTATSMGLAVPEAIRARADEVIG
jgi:putative tryptophan/tyrosine transport system substrate-binding protein